jgi:hypothetical protein
MTNNTHITLYSNIDGSQVDYQFISSDEAIRTISGPDGATVDERAVLAGEVIEQVNRLEERDYTVSIHSGDIEELELHELMA